MRGKAGKRFALGVGTWLLGLACAAAQSPSPAPMLGFSEARPVAHTTQCHFPEGSPLTPREPASFAEAAKDDNLVPVGHEVTQAGWFRKSESDCATGHCGLAARCWSNRHFGGRLGARLVDCVCCQDPCYEPCWMPIADVAFHTPAVRPVTQMRLRWNHGDDVRLPDRAEFFWARADGAGHGPTPPPGARAVTSVRHHDLFWSFEAAAGRFSLLVDVPYRALDPVDLPKEAGFGDVRVGTKALVLDCELLQVGVQFLATTPTADAGKGLGIGHTALEPSLLAGLRVGPDTYVQMQAAEWFPVGGDPDYSGAVLHTHTSLNQVLYRVRPDLCLIACAEASTWSFQDGAYTDPVLGSFQQASGTTYAAVGPGLRWYFCGKIDFGVAASFGVTSPRFYGQLYTAEFRWRF